METRTITPLENGELADLLKKTCITILRSGFIKVGGCVLPENYKEFADSMENFQVRDDDVWVCSFPKSGTTWVQEMVWCIANDLEFKKAEVFLPDRFPHFEHNMGARDGLVHRQRSRFRRRQSTSSREVSVHRVRLIANCPNNFVNLVWFIFLFKIFNRCTAALEITTEIVQRSPGIKFPDYFTDSVNYAENLASPRFIKTHLHTNLLPRESRTGEKKPKVIYVVRNPKDTCISFYHYCTLVEGFKGNFEEFCTLFLGDTLYYGPFWKNVLRFWNRRSEYNMLFLKYEDMKMDLPSVIKKTATFLGKNLTNDQVSKLNEHLSFSSMKANPSVNYENTISEMQRMLQVKREGTFIRSGKNGQWKTEMTPELIKKFDDWTEENLTGTGLSV